MNKRISRFTSRYCQEWASNRFFRFPIFLFAEFSIFRFHIAQFSSIKSNVCVFCMKFLYFLCCLLVSLRCVTCHYPFMPLYRFLSQVEYFTNGFVCQSVSQSVSQSASHKWQIYTIYVCDFLWVSFAIPYLIVKLNQLCFLMLAK